jgi:hypothetical protein
LVVVGKKDIKEVVITNNLDFPGPEQSTFAVLSPGDQAAVINVNNQANPLPSWYKFEFSGSRRSVSATMCVRDAALGCSAAVSAQ